MTWSTAFYAACSQRRHRRAARAQRCRSLPRPRRRPEDRRRERRSAPEQRAAFFRLAAARRSAASRSSEATRMPVFFPAAAPRRLMRREAMPSIPGPVHRHGEEPIYFPSSPLRYIREQAGAGASIVYDAGTDLAQAAKTAAASQVAIVFVTQWMSEGEDAERSACLTSRTHLSPPWPPPTRTPLLCWRPADP